MLKGKSGKIISAALTFSLTLSLLSTSLFSAQAETAVNQSTSVGRSDAAESISLSKREIKWKEGEIIRIMPLGDSITENDNCYWRLMLWNKLAEAGYDSSKIDFVGDRWGDRDMTTQNEPEFANADRNNSGTRGATSSDVASWLPSILENNTPDIMMIFLGANDLSGNRIHDVHDNIAKIITDSRAVKENMIFVVTLLPPMRLGGVWETNVLLNRLQEEMSMENSPVVIVDQYSDNTLEDISKGDGVHPDYDGGTRLCERYFPVIKSLLDGVIPDDVARSYIPAPEGYDFACFSYNNDNHHFAYNGGDYDIKFGVDTAFGDNPKYLTYDSKGGNYGVEDNLKFTEAKRFSAGEADVYIGHYNDPAPGYTKYFFYRPVNAPEGWPDYGELPPPSVDPDPETPLPDPDIPVTEGKNAYRNDCSTLDGWTFSNGTSGVVSDGKVIVTSQNGSNGMAQLTFDTVNIPVDTNKLNIEMKFKLGESYPNYSLQFPIISDNGRGDDWTTPIQGVLLDNGVFKNFPDALGNSSGSEFMQPGHEYTLKYKINFTTKTFDCELKDLTNNNTFTQTDSNFVKNSLYAGFYKLTFLLDGGMSDTATVEFDEINVIPMVPVDSELEYEILYENSSITHQGGDYASTSLDTAINAQNGLTLQYDVDLSQISGDIKSLPTIAAGPYVAQVNEHTPSIISVMWGSFRLHTRQHAYDSFGPYNYTEIAPADYSKKYRITVTMSFDGQFGNQKISIYNLTDDVSVVENWEAPLSASGISGEEWGDSILFTSFNSLSGNYNGATGSLTAENIKIYVIPEKQKNLVLEQFADKLTVYNESQDNSITLRVKADSDEINISSFNMYIASYDENKNLKSVRQYGPRSVDESGFTTFCANAPADSYSVMLWSDNLIPYINVI